jgi:hypothetical protein
MADNPQSIDDLTDEEIARNVRQSAGQQNNNANHGNNHGADNKEKPKGFVASAFSELGDFVKKAAAVATIGVLPFAYGSFAPAHVASAQAFTYGMSAGRATSNLIQKKPVLKGTIHEAAVGAVLSYPVSRAFTGLNSLENTVAASYGAVSAKAAKIGATVFGLQPVITAGRTLGIYGIGKNFREHLWPSVKTTFKYLAVPGAINVGYVYQFGILAQMAFSASVSYAFGLIQSLRTGEGSFKNLLPHLNPISYAKSGATVTGKLVRNASYGIGEALRAIYSGVSNSLYSTSKPGGSNANSPPAPTPQPTQSR